MQRVAGLRSHRTATRSGSNLIRPTLVIKVAYPTSLFPIPHQKLLFIISDLVISTALLEDFFITTQPLHSASFPSRGALYTSSCENASISLLILFIYFRPQRVHMQLISLIITSLFSQVLVQITEMVVCINPNSTPGIPATGQVSSCAISQKPRVAPTEILYTYNGY